MGSLNIQTIRNNYSRISDAEAAAALAQKYGYIAIVRYKSSPSAPDYTDFGTCKTPEEVTAYLNSPYCHAAEIIFDRRTSATQKIPDSAARLHPVEDDPAKELCVQAATLRRAWDQPEKLDKAEAIFREAISRYPNSSLAHYGLGELLGLKAAQASTKSGPIFEESIRELKHALELDPAQSAAAIQLAGTLAPDDFDAAKIYYDKVIAAGQSASAPLYPASWQASGHFQIAIEASERGDDEIGIEAFIRAMTLDEQYTGMFMPEPPRANAVWQRALSKLGETAWFKQQEDNDTMLRSLFAEPPKPKSQWWQFWKTEKRAASPVLLPTTLREAASLQTSPAKPPTPAPSAEIPAVEAFNRGVAMFRDGKYHQACEAFDTCLKDEDVKLQAAYAQGLCHQKMGRQPQLPGDLADRSEVGAMYVASNLVCYLIQQGHKAALQPYGDSTTTWNVTAEIDGTNYTLQISAAFFGAFSNWAWRKTDGKSISIADRNENRNPTRTDELVLSLVSKASSLPMSPLPDTGLPITSG